MVRLPVCWLQRFIRSEWRYALLLAVALAPLDGLHAQSLPGHAVVSDQVPTLDSASTGLREAISLGVSQGRLVTLAQPAGSVFVADPTIADAQIPLTTRLFIFGRKVGHTTIYILSPKGDRLASFEVSVTNDTRDVQQAIAPTAGSVAAAPTSAGVTLQGSFPTPDAADRIVANANSALSGTEKLTNQTTVSSSAQVMIHVRFAEVARSVTKDLGINWSAIGNPGAFSVGFFSGRSAFSGASTSASNFSFASNGDSSASFGVSTSRLSISNVIDALASDGLVTTLAEPTLTTISGQPASFLAGGEFPIPVANTGSGASASITISFKEYGVSLSFVPTVYSNNHISMHVRPEVSEISTTGAVVENGITIPGLVTRRADTTVELGSGESFAIAGLLQNTTSTTLTHYPGLGNLPILGPLFHSSNFQHNETELIIVVTPYIVQPIDDPRQLKLPTDHIVPASDIERILSGQTTALPDQQPVPPTSLQIPNLNAPHLIGPAGFDVE